MTQCASSLAFISHIASLLTKKKLSLFFGKLGEKGQVLVVMYLSVRTRLLSKRDQVVCDL